MKRTCFAKLCYVFSFFALFVAPCITVNAYDEDDIEQQDEDYYDEQEEYIEEEPIVAYRQWYSFKMKLYVPRVYDNNKSLGYRKI